MKAKTGSKGELYPTNLMLDMHTALCLQSLVPMWGQSREEVALFIIRLFLWENEKKLTEYLAKDSLR